MKKKLALCVDVPAKTLELIKKYCDVTIAGELLHGRGKTNALETRTECMGHELVVLGDEPAPSDSIKAWFESGMRFIACGKGTPVSVDYDAVKSLGLQLCHTPGRNAVAVAEYAIGLMLAYSRKIAASYAGLMQGEHLGESKEDVYDYPDLKNVVWSPLDETSPQYDYGFGFELHGLTLGIAGYGAIGSRVALLGRAFGMEVIAYDKYCPSARISADGIEPVTLEELLKRSDILSLHLSTTPETTEMIDATWFGKMKPSAFIVNTARAKIIHQRDFVEALQKGVIGGAAIDVCWEEPIPSNHPLLKMKNVLITPHMAGVTTNMDWWTGEIVAQDILRYCRGEELKNVWRKNDLKPNIPQTHKPECNHNG